MALLERAQAAGLVNPDLDAREVFSLVSSLPDGFRDDTGSSTLIDVLLRGMKT